MHPTRRHALTVSLLLAAACTGGGSSETGSSSGDNASSGGTSSGSSGGGSGTSSGGSGPRSGTPCQQLAQTLCPLLEACPETAGSNDCKYIIDTGTLGVSCKMCRVHFEKDFCGDTTKTDTFFQECLAAVDAKKASCGPDHTGEQQGILLPTECFPLLECNAGPCLH